LPANFWLPIAKEEQKQAATIKRKERKQKQRLIPLIRLSLSYPVQASLPPFILVKHVHQRHPARPLRRSSRLSTASQRLVSARISIDTERRLTTHSGSQIFTPGTGTCYTTPSGGQQLCLYQTNTAGQQVVTFLCGTVCYDAGKYRCSGTVLTDQSGVPSLAAARSTAAANVQATTQLGTATSATPVASGALISSQSRLASSVAASAARSSSRVSGGAAAASSTAARSDAQHAMPAVGIKTTAAFLTLAALFAFGIAL
jgi:hypothetical protein